MTLQRLFTNIDTAPAGLLLAIFGILAAVCAFIMVARWVARKAAGARRRLSYRNVKRIMDRIKSQAIYVGPVYWPAMDKLRALWVEREEREKDGGST